MTQIYGPDKVAFIKVNGPKVHALADLFGVSGYPTFHSVTPSSNGQPFKKFKYNPRNYDTLRQWMEEVISGSDQAAAKSAPVPPTKPV